MTTTWPHESPYAEAAALLREAIGIAAIRDAVDEFTASMREVTKVNTTHAEVSNDHSTNIRDDLAALINERARRVDTAFNAPNSEEDLS